MINFLRVISIPIFLLCGNSVFAEIRSWETSIEKVRQLHREYFDFAIKLDSSSMPGSSLQGIGYNRHVCAIVGRMLGFREEIKKAEYLEHPPMTSNSNPFLLMEHAMLLDSWVAAASNAVQFKKSQKASLWNLECLGQFNIPSDAFYAEDRPTEFSKIDNRVLIYGAIDFGFHKRFLSFLESNADITEIALGSGGGSVIDAILSGQEIRKRGLNTTLFGPCYSACPLVFSGGVQRSIWMGEGPFLGFHQVYKIQNKVPQALAAKDPIYVSITNYLADMGVDPTIVTNWMMSAEPSDMYHPSLEALCDSKLATWIQRTCY